MRTKSDGLDRIKANIEKAKREHAKRVEQAVSQMGDVALWGARNCAPVDKGSLESSLEKSMQTDSKFVAAVIRVPLNSPAQEYAVEQHEFDHNPGPNTKAKTARLGITAGKKYITRGVEMGIKRYEAIVKALLKV